MNDTIKQFFEACQPFGFPLLACSLTMAAAIAYHLLFTGSNRALKRLSRGLNHIRQGGKNARENLAAQCRLAHTPLEIIALHALECPDDSNLQARLESQLRLLIDNERAGMATISVITNIAPMLGILGTAWGLVDIFGVFGTPGAQEGIALGISKALYTTIFGLAIAVPGIIALTCFERALERRAARINNFFTELLSLRSQQ